MRYSIYQLLSFCFVIFCFQACSPIYYIPNTQNVPAIMQKADAQISLSGNGNQFELQGAYGISDQYALMLNTDFVTVSNPDNDNVGKAQFVELGPGYYRNLSDRWLFDTYLLVGRGNIDNHLPSYTTNTNIGQLNANIWRIALQPSLSFHRKYLRLTASTRLAHINYSQIEGLLIADGQSQAQYLTDNKSNFLIEPAISLNVGLEQFKMQIQYLYSYNINNVDFKQDNQLLSVGINYHFNTKGNSNY